MAELVTVALHPPVHEPVLVVVLEGWIDAGAAATTAMQTILEAHGSELVASFDTDTLLDHRARRPMMSLVEGQMTSLTWPSIELRALTDERGRHVLVLVGAEPDHEWRRFTDAVVDLALELGVTLGRRPRRLPRSRPPHPRHPPRPHIAVARAARLVQRLRPRDGRGAGRHPGVDRACRVGRRAPRHRAVGAGAALHLGHALRRRPPSPWSKGWGGSSRSSCNRACWPPRLTPAASHLDELVAGNPQHQAMITPARGDLRRHRHGSRPRAAAHRRRTGRRVPGVPPRTGRLGPLRATSAPWRSPFAPPGRPAWART